MGGGKGALHMFVESGLITVHGEDVVAVFVLNDGVGDVADGVKGVNLPDPPCTQRVVVAAGTVKTCQVSG
jgi:hypothetical protein